VNIEENCEGFGATLKRKFLSFKTYPLKSNGVEK